MSGWWLVDRILGLYGVRRPPPASPRPLLRTRRENLARYPQGVFSALLTRLTAAAYDQLSETQQVAWLIATYDLAVRNGGHSEYFAVFGVDAPPRYAPLSRSWEPAYSVRFWLTP